MAKAAHQGIDCGTPTRLRSILLQPFAKSCIQSLMLRPGDQPRLLNQVSVSA